LLAGKRLARKLAAETYRKLGFDIELIDLSRLCDFTNYFLIVSGKNRMHLEALSELTLEIARDRDTFVAGKEGSSASGWIIIDFGDLVVHIFDTETREYYNLRGIWGDAPTVELDLKEDGPGPGPG